MLNNAIDSDRRSDNHDNTLKIYEQGKTKRMSER